MNTKTREAPTHGNPLFRLRDLIYESFRALDINLQDDDIYWRDTDLYSNNSVFLIIRVDFLNGEGKRSAHFVEDTSEMTIPQVTTDEFFHSVCDVLTANAQRPEAESSVPLTVRQAVDPLLVENFSMRRLLKGSCEGCSDFTRDPHADH